MTNISFCWRPFCRKAAFVAIPLTLVTIFLFGMQVTGARAEVFSQETPTAAANAEPTIGPDDTSPITAPAPLPADESAISPQGNQPPPPAEDLKTLAAALKSAISQRQEMSLAYLIYRVGIDHVQYSPDRATALVWLSFTDPESGKNIATEPGLAVARREAANSWQVTLQVDAEWNDTLDALPERLLNADAKAELRFTGPQAETTEALTGYKLPWKGGTYNYVTGSIGHVLTYKSCPNTCLYAFDFADGSMFGVYAARAGRVKYAQWTYPNGNTENTNYLVLEDASTSPTTYQVYYHLAQNSIPSALRKAGAVVNQGQFIANADDTGASTGHHLHFHVHTTPNAVWGTSVDIRFSDVIINSGRPRTCAEAKAYPGYGSQCPPGNKLLSGNTSGPLPAAPVPVAPSGTVKTPTPTFQWKTVSAAAQYALYVYKAGTTTTVINQIFNNSICTGGVCSYTPTTGLADGSYTFKVRAGGATGWSGFSAALAFKTSGVPEIPVLISPTGTIYVNNPAYTWKAVAGADRYYLMVYSAKSSSYIIYRTVMAVDVCRDDTCSYTSTINVKHGAYKFKVRSGNGYGWSAYSAFMPFDAYLAPFPPVLGDPLPDSKVTLQRPYYRWTASATATKYALQVYSMASKAYVVNTSAASTYLCTGAVCWWRPVVSLKAGQYRWRMRAYSSYGWGNYTGWVYFNVQLVPDPPELVAPNGTISTLSPAYTWKKVTGATYYYLMVWDVAAGEYIIYRGKAVAEVCGAGDTCSYVSTINVENGKSYRFKVRAYNDFGWGAFSPEMSFNVQP